MSEKLNVINEEDVETKVSVIKIESSDEQELDNRASEYVDELVNFSLNDLDKQKMNTLSELTELANHSVGILLPLVKFVDSNPSSGLFKILPSSSSPLTCSSSIFWKDVWFLNSIAPSFTTESRYSDGKYL